MVEGYRWPAEWEHHEATWLSWPHNPDTWPDSLPAVEGVFAELVRVISQNERVRIALGARAEGDVRECLAASGVSSDRSVDLLPIETNDAWIRDHGPMILVATSEESGEARMTLDFAFDNWGRKYSGWEADDCVPRYAADFLRTPRRAIPWVLEGGSVDGDGQGTVLTTESCLLNPNRCGDGQTRTRATMEARLAETLGARRVIWLADGIAGDDTDGHIDDIARFVSPGVVVAVRGGGAADPDRAVHEENWARLTAGRDARGERLQVIPLPAPPPLVRDGQRLPASYANFYLANGVAAVPTFGVETDDAALRVLEGVLSEREIVPIRCERLVEGLGALHCVTQQEPKANKTSYLRSSPASEGEAEARSEREASEVH